MAPSFVAFPALSIVRKEDFDDTTLIPVAYAPHMSSRCLPPERNPVHCTASAEPAGPAGIRLRFSSTVENLDEPAMLVHRFYFIDRDETRERLHAIGPDEPEAVTELLILFDGRDRDYFQASVYDAENRMLAVHAIVFDATGRTIAYPFTGKYVSPLHLGRAELVQTVDEEGRRVLRFTVGLEKLAEATRVDIAWQTIGLIERRELWCTPEQPEVSYDVPLDDNPRLAPADWVIIAVDENNGFLAQTLVTVLPAE
jgi:hypothetical protein